MSNQIAFINSRSDAAVARDLFSDSLLFRVPVHLIGQIDLNEISDRVWVDAGFDGFPDHFEESEWAGFIRQFPGYEDLSDATFVAKPAGRIVSKFVSSVMDRCLAYRPAAISVPQLPHLDGVDRNPINRKLAQAFVTWKRKVGYEGATIVPAIMTNQRQITNKGPRDKKVKAIASVVQTTSATGVWAVDHTLRDQAGTTNFEERRFPGIIKLHGELSKIKGLRFNIAGPYWGLNIVMWARGDITNPAISMGTGYQYYRTGQHIKSPTPRVALAPLRRWAKATADLGAWIDEVLRILPQNDAARAEFEELAKSHQLSVQGAHKQQVARFYRDWLARIGKHQGPARGVALYQDLSSAYVIGKQLPAIPSESGRARDPAVVAQQLMLVAL